MRRVPVVVGSAVAVALLTATVMLDRERTKEEDAPVEVIFADSDGLPEELREGYEYRATFRIEWTGPISMRDGDVSVFASRRGDTSEDAPEDGWPLVCESEFDDVVFQARLACPFVAPGPGEFALQVQVEDAAGDKIGDTIYTHLIVDPSTTEPPDTTAEEEPTESGSD